MKYLMLCSVFLTSFCHRQNDNLCQIINVVLEFEPAQEQYWFNRNKEKPIMIVDTNYSFKKCRISKHFNREVFITENKLNAYDEDPSNYVITLDQIRRDLFKIQLLYRFRGAASIFTIKLKKGKYTILKYDKMYI
jgi:hypothetical protein